MGAIPPVPRLERLRDRIRTGQAYGDWIRRFIIFHGKLHPPGIEAFLTHLDRMFE